MGASRTLNHKPYYWSKRMKSSMSLLLILLVAATNLSGAYPSRSSRVDHRAMKLLEDLQLSKTAGELLEDLQLARAAYDLREDLNLSKPAYELLENLQLSKKLDKRPVFQRYEPRERYLFAYLSFVLRWTKLRLRLQKVLVNISNLESTMANAKRRVDTLEKDARAGRRWSNKQVKQRETEIEGVSSDLDKDWQELLGAWKEVDSAWVSASKVLRHAKQGLDAMKYNWVPRPGVSIEYKKRAEAIRKQKKRIEKAVKLVKDTWHWRVKIWKDVRKYQEWVKKDCQWATHKLKSIRESSRSDAVSVLSEEETKRRPSRHDIRAKGRAYNRLRSIADGTAGFD